MRPLARPLLIGTAVLAIAAGAALVFTSTGQEPSCFDRLSSGPNSNTSRLTTTLDIPRSEWAQVAQVMREFAVAGHWSIREGVGSTDATYRWLEMCDDTVTTIRAGNQDGPGDTVAFGIVHMEYTEPGNTGWQPIYRDLHARLEARWPGRMHYVEGEFGATIPRPAWLDVAAPQTDQTVEGPVGHPVPDDEAAALPAGERIAPSATDPARAMYETLLRAAGADATALAGGATHLVDGESGRPLDLAFFRWIDEAEVPLFPTQQEIPDEQESACVCTPERHACDLFQPGGVTSVFFTAEALRIVRVESESP